MINISVVDDQFDDFKRLEEYLLRFSKENDMTFNIVHYKDALELFDDYKKADVIFMDVDMPHLNGIDAAQKLRKIDKNVALVFVTNMVQYAIKGYEVNALDYVLKPLNYAKFSSVIKKALHSLEENQDTQLFLKTVGGGKKIYQSEIIYIEIENHLLMIHTEKQTINSWGSLKDISKNLPENFIRCSKDTIVNIKYIASIDKDTIELEKTEDKVYISRSMRKEFLTKLSQYMVKK